MQKFRSQGLGMFFKNLTYNFDFFISKISLRSENVSKIGTNRETTETKRSQLVHTNG